MSAAAAFVMGAVLFTAWPGSYEGLAGVRPTKVTLVVEAATFTQAVGWFQREGQSREGRVQFRAPLEEGNLRLSYGDFRCNLRLGDNATLLGTCHEDIGAQARVPISFEWTGTRRPDPRVERNGLSVTPPPGWEPSTAHPSGTLAWRSSQGWLLTWAVGSSPGEGLPGGWTAVNMAGRQGMQREDAQASEVAWEVRWPGPRVEHHLRLRGALEDKALLRAVADAFMQSAFSK